MKALLLFALAAVLFVARVSGQEAAADTLPPFRVTLDFAYLNAAGNTALSTLGAGENLEWRTRRVELLQNGSVIYGRSEGVTTTEQMLLGGRANFILAKGVGFFVGLGFERNRFAGLSRRFEENAGASFRVLDQPRDTWMLEFGAALNQQLNTAGVRETFASLRGATSVRHNFSEAAFLLGSVEVLPRIDDWTDTRMNNELSVVAPLSGHVALKVSYLIKFDNLPEPGFRKSDRVFTSGIQVVF